MDRRNGQPCHTCGLRPVNGKKVVRWAENLADSQAIELAAQLSRTLAKTVDIDPAALRQTLVTFVRGALA